MPDYYLRRRVSSLTRSNCATNYTCIYPRVTVFTPFLCPLADDYTEGDQNAAVGKNGYDETRRTTTTYDVVSYTQPTSG